MAEVKVSVKRTLNKMKLGIYYNEQEDKYQMQLEDASGPEPVAIVLEVTPALLQEIKDILQASPDIEILS